MVAKLDLSMLTQASSPGGASVLVSNTELQPAAGPLAGVAPARYVGRSGATYAYEDRFDGDQPVKAVLIDGKGSQANRAEDAVSQCIKDGHLELSLTPRIELHYPGHEPVTCLDLPHRAIDGHIRAGSVDGLPVGQDPTYLAARNATTVDLRPLLEMSGASVGFGLWDASRARNQLRLRSPLVGEIVGILSNPDADEPMRGGARVDDLAPSVRLSPDDFERLLERQAGELSSKKVDALKKEADKARKKKGTVSAAALGLGNIPPSLETLGLVSCRKIVRHHVLSFATLRQWRFGLGPDGNATVRALVAAWTLTALAYSDAELNLRAGCDLREAGPSRVVLDGRYGKEVELEPLTPGAMSALLGEAIEAATKAGLRWEGQVLRVDGDPSVISGATADEDASEGA